MLATLCAGRLKAMSALLSGSRAALRDRSARRIAAALLVLYALLYLLPLGVRPLASPDEVRYGAIAHEILASGDWISPHLDGVRYFEKPVLGYWLNAASLAALGETPFALRLPVALATGLTALVLLRLSRRFLTAAASWLAAAIFLTTFLVAGLGTFAVLDAYLALFLTAALAGFYLALEAERPAERRAWLALCGAACAGAFLVKGFLALAIPVLVAAPYLAARRRWRALLTTPWWPIGVAALLVLPWAVAIRIEEPDFWHYFFWVEHVRRFTSSDAQHAQPFWYYFAWLPLAGWPWIWLLPAALLGLRRRRAGGADRESRFLWYAAAWALLPLLFLSLSKGKLPTYILPCFAPLSILLAAGLEPCVDGTRRRAFSIAAALMALPFLALLAALAAAEAGAFGAPPFAAAERAKLAEFVLLAACGAGCAILASAARGPVLRLGAVAGAGAALILPLQIAVPQRALDNIAPATTLAPLAQTPADTLVVSDAPLFGTVAWVLKRSDIYVLSAGEIEYGLSYPDSRARLLDDAGLRRLLAERGKRGVLVVCSEPTASRIAGVLPAAARRDERGKVVVWRLPGAETAG